MKPTLVYTLLATAAYALPQAPTNAGATPGWLAGLLGGLLGGQPGAQPGGQINTPEALASPGTGKYGAVSTSASVFIQVEVVVDE
jgi:hypothetical protein